MLPFLHVLRRQPLILTAKADQLQNMQEIEACLEDSHPGPEVVSMVPFQGFLDPYYKQGKPREWEPLTSLFSRSQGSPEERSDKQTKINLA